MTAFMGSVEVSAVYGKKPAVTLDNFIFDGTNGWRKTSSASQPSVTLGVSTNWSDYSHMGLPKIHPSHTEAITDTGVQSNLLGLKIFHQLGFKKHDLVGVKNCLRAINQEEINILGHPAHFWEGPDHWQHC